MSSTKHSEIKKRLGRPATGVGTPVLIRFQPEQLAAIDEWIVSKNNPKLTRAMAIRLMVQMALQDRRKAPREEG